MLNFILVLLVLMVVVSLITSLIIETIKKIVSEGTIKSVFKSLEIFALTFTFIVSLITFIVYLLFTVKAPITLLEGIQYIVIGLVFMVACGCGSQVGYDKVIKTIKQIIALFGGSNAIQ